MGAEREDTEPAPKRAGTEPGLGCPPSGEAASDGAQSPDEGPPPVDFDALNAALGDPLDYQQLASGPANEMGASESEDPLESVEVDHVVRGGDSSGQLSATYASLRAHTIPPTRAPSDDLDVPPVIVSGDDTVPSGPPQMTVPMMPAVQSPVARGPAVPPASNPYMRHPSSGQQPAAFRTPGPGPAQVLPRGMLAHQSTVRMPDRPVPPSPIHPRRPQKSATLLVRPRGPSTKQKLVAFMVMLLVMTVGGIAVIMVRRPRWVGGFEPRVPPDMAPRGTESISGSGAVKKHKPAK